MKLNNKIREKIVNAIIELLKKRYLLDNVAIIYNNKMDLYGESTIDCNAEDIIIYPGKLYETKHDISVEDYNGNPETIVVIYDGGALYSCMSDEYDYSSSSNFTNELDKILQKYNLYLEEIDQTSFTLGIL